MEKSLWLSDRFAEISLQSVVRLITPAQEKVRVRCIATGKTTVFYTFQNPNDVQHDIQTIRTETIKCSGLGLIFPLVILQIAGCPEKLGLINSVRRGTQEYENILQRTNTVVAPGKTESNRNRPSQGELLVGLANFNGRSELPSQVQFFKADGDKRQNQVWNIDQIKIEDRLYEQFSTANPLLILKRFRKFC